MEDASDRSRLLRKAAAGVPLAFAPLVLSVIAFTDASSSGAPEGAGVPDPVPELEVRAAVLARGFTLLDRFYEEEVAPVESMLAPFHHDREWVQRVALALVREGAHVGVDPRILASVVLVENPWLSPTAVSPVGAVGIMQVMPFHAGAWGCSTRDLTDLEANVCHGARIFAAYLERHDEDLDRALLAYNGCVRGTNTPDCAQYPFHVYSRAGRAAVHQWLEIGRPRHSTPSGPPSGMWR